MLQYLYAFKLLGVWFVIVGFYMQDFRCIDFKSVKPTDGRTGKLDQMFKDCRSPRSVAESDQFYGSVFLPFSSTFLEAFTYLYHHC